jgi:hypothetical protein
MDLFNIINLSIIGGLCYCLFHYKKVIDDENKLLKDTVIEAPPLYTH